MNRTIAIITILAAAFALAACGSGSAAPALTSTPAPGATAQAGGRFGNRTPRPEVQTAIAEGTMPAGRLGGGTPPPDAQTAIAEGTPFPGRFGGTPPASVQTAIASGTFTAGRGGFGGGAGRTITAVATLLGISEDQLRSELQAAGATIASVAAAHGKDRPAVRQALISDTTQRIQAQVTNGRISQGAADQAIKAFTDGVDSVLDSDGSMPPTMGGTP
jgi:hypothetical protein